MTILRNRKVSVVIPNYNYKKYLRKRIESILEQTYPIYELIILDDGSTDGSVAEIKKILKKHSFKLLEHNLANNRGENNYSFKNEKLNVRFIINEKNSGKAISQWKKGFEVATGDFIWIAEADDLSSRKFLEKVMEGFKDAEVVLSYAESMIISGMGLIIASNFRWSRDKEKTGHYEKSYVKDGAQEIEEIMAIRCTIPNVSAVVFRNDAKIPYKKYLGEALKFSQVGDWYFYSKILEHGKISYNRESLNKFRVHKESKTAKAKKGRSHYEEVLDMHKMLLKKYDLGEEMKNKMEKEEKRIAERIEG
ncbi:glycosyltransferase family 2 protein [Candidatus Saccharibacteria bacterium]|nr:glycosyltransferase family 2 protein [Candidatus Saccharibacteria bacterium]